MAPDAWEDFARRLKSYDYIEYAALVREKRHRLRTEYDENGHLKPEIEEKHCKSWERFLNSDWGIEDGDGQSCDEFDLLQATTYCRIPTPASGETSPERSQGAGKGT